jgi:hypothetical protein
MQVDKVYTNKDKDWVIFKLKRNDLLNFEGGLVNRNQLKSFYYVISSHIQVDSINPMRELKLLAKSIRQIVHKHTSGSPDILPRNIVLFDYPESFSETRKGFFKLEFNFFNKEMDRRQINSFLNMLSSTVESEVKVQPHITLKNKRVNRKRY